MPIKTSRVRNASKPERTYHGEAEAQFLVGQLNQGGMIERDSLREIIRPLQELGECQSKSPSRIRSSDPGHRERLLKAETANKAVNKILRQYEARPHLRLLAPLGEEFRLEWQRAEGADLELQAVLSAVKLAQEGRISSLKECANPNCRLWLFARFNHQRFCSETCKELFHRTDEQEKARRRNWAKHNYWLHKNKNVK